MLGLFGHAAEEFRRQVMRSMRGCGHTITSRPRGSEFANIPRPGYEQDFIAESLSSAFSCRSGAEFAQKISHKRRNIFSAIAQWRDVKRNHVKPVEKILAKAPRAIS